MKKPIIAVIDTGIDSEAPASQSVTSFYDLKQTQDGLMICETKMDDRIGHGTAVTHIIWDTYKDINLIVFRICNNDLGIDESGLITILEFIDENLEVDIINISAGITYIYDYEALYNVCQSLYKKGTIIVCAYDNDGALSFPASLDCVIGVDVNKYIDKNEIVVVKEGKINVIVYDKYFRTEWLKTRTLIRGTSFACGYVSGLLAKNFNENNNIETMLQAISTRTETQLLHEEIAKPKFTINKAIIFPVNKESHAIIRFKDSLSFDLIGCYDDKLSGKVGKEIFGEKVKSYDDINWEGDFDTIILSCVSDLSTLTKRQYVNEIVDNAVRFGKNVYSFEQIPLINENMYYPVVKKKNVPVENNMKLYKSTIPTVAVVGTSSKQGKFTMQQKIIKNLAQIGYDVGSIISEPSGYLFGADFVFHFGYHADIELHPSEYISILNEMIFDIQKKQKDILITGCQSGVIHYNNSQINEFAIAQYAFLLGILADIYILCVNPHDNLEYIKKSIDFLNSIDEGKVKAIVIFPVKAMTTLSGIGYKLEEIRDDEFSTLKTELQNKFNLPVFSMVEADVEKLCIQIINEFV